MLQTPPNQGTNVQIATSATPFSPGDVFVFFFKRVFLTLYNMFLQLAHHVRVVKKTSPFWIVSTSQDQLWPSWYFRVQMDPNGMQLRMGFEPFGYKTGL
jgi:hypothetical protein